MYSINDFDLFDHIQVLFSEIHSNISKKHNFLSNPNNTRWMFFDINDIRDSIKQVQVKRYFKVKQKREILINYGIIIRWEPLWTVISYIHMSTDSIVATKVYWIQDYVVADLDQLALCIPMLLDQLKFQLSTLMDQ